MWLSKNIKRFRYKPFLAKSKKGTDLYFFEGISHSIALTVKHYSLECIMLKNNEIQDILIAWDIDIKQADNEKYYCSICKDFNKAELKFYKTPSELLATHSFEELLKWVNELDEEDSLYFYQIGECRWAKIATKPDADDKKYLVSMNSIIKHKANENASDN